jgi:membrane protease YdiL (CAAX protease family)
MSNYAMVAPLKLVSDKSPILSLLIIFLVVMIGGIVGSMLGNAIAIDFYDGNFLRDLQNDSLKPGSLPLILTLQGINTFIALIFFPLLYITMVEHKKVNPFFPTQPKLGTLLLLVAVVGVSFPIAISPLTEWNLNLKFPEFLKSFEEWAIGNEEALAKLTKQATSFRSLSDMLLGVFVIGLLPAIGEELVFRGMIQREFWRAKVNIHVSIWMTAAIFSAIHLQFFGFFPRLLLGALFGYLYYWSGNLLIPIFSHFINNAFIVVMVYLNIVEVSSIDMESGEAPPLHFVIICAIITIALVYYIWKHYTEFFPPVERHDNSYPNDSPLAR